MTIYEHKANLTTVAGTVASTTLRIPGGIARYFLVRALTSPALTTFRADLTDEDGIVRVNYGYHVGELRDDIIEYPLAGTYTVNITNVGPSNDTFRIILSVQEN